MARLVLALLALTAVNAGHCAGGGLENYCCMVACDSSYGTHPGDPNCGGAAASVTRMSDVYAIASNGGCSPLSPGECSFGSPQEATCTAQLGFDPRTRIGASAASIGAALSGTPATSSPTDSPTVSPTAYPTFTAAFIAANKAAAVGNASSGHALYMAGSHTAALTKYQLAYQECKTFLGDGGLLTKGMKHRASIVSVASGAAPLTGLDNNYPSATGNNDQEAGLIVHQGGAPGECGTSNIASFTNGVVGTAVTHKGNRAQISVTCNPGFIGKPFIQCAPIASGGATRGISEGESGHQWVSVGSCDFDPWYNKGWASTTTGTSTGTVAVTQTGSVTGHLVIVHDSAGTKVGCGPLILNNQNKNVAAITTIPGYTGSLTVAGTFTFVQAAAQLSGVYTLTGLPAATSGAFHVHAGTSCAAVGGHFPNPSTTANPTPGHVHYSTLGYGVQTSA